MLLFVSIANVSITELVPEASQSHNPNQMWYIDVEIIIKNY